MTQLKISYCIVCMNRLHQLKETLVKNINDEKNNNDVEFVLLDYNSKDGMEAWAKLNLATYIETGKLKYYKTPDPDSFSHSHSKNMAFRLSTGDVICSINADHYIGEGFTDYIKNTFKKQPKAVITPIDFHSTKFGFTPPKDVLGKVCVKKDDFLTVTGYNEIMKHYGFEDYDLINRMELIGAERHILMNEKYLQYIAHDENERYEINTDALNSIHVQWLSPSHSNLLYLFNNHTFETFTLIDNARLNTDNYVSSYSKRYYRYEHSVKYSSWVKGAWNNEDDSADSAAAIVTKLKFTVNDKPFTLTETLNPYKKLINPNTINHIMVHKYFLQNRIIMERNMATRKVKVNKGGFGKGRVFKNFNTNEYIDI